MTESAVVRQWACQQLLVRFFHLLDAKRYGELIGLFAHDAEWQRPGSTIRGHAAIAAALGERPAARATCHVVSNFLTGLDDGAIVQAGCLLTTYAVDALATGKSPRLIDSVAGLFTARASMRFEQGEASIARLELAPVWTFDRTP